MEPTTTAQPAPHKPFMGFRKIYHVVASSLIPLFYWYLPNRISQEYAFVIVLTASLSGFLVFFILDLVRLRDQKFNSFFMKFFSLLVRRSEEHRFTGSTFLCLAFVVVILCFDRLVAITAMLFLSLGDTAAEVGGHHFGRMKIFHRSIEGTIAFFGVAVFIAWFILDDWRVALIGAAVGALVELFSLEVDDNLTVPIGSALALWAVLRLFPPV